MTTEQLRAMAQSGQLRPEDLIWRDGWPDWVEASRASGLFPAPALRPPPLPVRRRRADDEDDEDDRPRRRRRRRRDYGWDVPTAVLLLIGTIIIPLVGIIAGAVALGSGSGTKRRQGGGLLLLALLFAWLYFNELNRR